MNDVLLKKCVKQNLIIMTGMLGFGFEDKPYEELGNMDSDSFLPRPLKKGEDIDELKIDELFQKAKELINSMGYSDEALGIEDMDLPRKSTQSNAHNNA